MALTKPLADSELGELASTVFAEMRELRKTDYVNQLWRVLANNPPLLKRTWDQVKEVMKPGAIDSVTKEMIYIAVSAANNCEYCLHTHTAAARSKGMTEAMFSELMDVIALASQTNRIAVSYQVETDDKYIKPLG
jgi:AhpD family alkylhydroperoxidase